MTTILKKNQYLRFFTLSTDVNRATFVLSYNSYETAYLKVEFNKKATNKLLISFKNTAGIKHSKTITPSKKAHISN